MSHLHPTTAALLAHIRSLPCVAEPRIDWSYVNAWEAAGYPDAPEPRFVPTSPGWYWRKGNSGAEPVKVAAGTSWLGIHGLTEPVKDDGLWLGPVAPWSEPLKPGEFLDGVVKRLTPSAVPPKPRTADEARASPLPGDMWRNQWGIYTVLHAYGARWWCRFDDGSQGAHEPGSSCGMSTGETYLGNFPVDP